MILTFSQGNTHGTPALISTIPFASISDMTRTLVTGFTPFEGREVNASWIATRQLGEHLMDPRVDLLEIPVVWGSPRELLEPLCTDEFIEIVIAMGEGREGWFDIETRARRTPILRKDNSGNLPGRLPWPDGPEIVNAGIDAGRLQEQLREGGAPVRVSRDAGGFLCEQTLYTLELLRRQQKHLKTVVFVHLPPWGTELEYQNETVTCDETVLRDFSISLFEAIRDIHSDIVDYSSAPAPV
ncbi:MAG: hypothetical protein HUJ31_11895 [Pseudomonadales bacterium]|nr:hypothetical protein [Pseudomonadales bacterium]